MDRGGQKPVPPKTGSGSNPARFCSQSQRTGSGSNPIRFLSDPGSKNRDRSTRFRFGPNIRSDRFQRTGAIFFTVGFPIVVIQPKSSRVFIRMFRRLKWDKRGDKSVGKWSKTQKNGYIAVGKLLASCYCEEYAGKKWTVGTGSEPVPRNRIANRWWIIRFGTGSSIKNVEPDTNRWILWEPDRILPEPVLTGFSSGQLSGYGSGTGSLGHL